MLLDLAASPTKEGPTSRYGGAQKAVDGVVSESNLEWAACNHGASGANPWWGVDLGSQRQVTKVKLYNRNNCCPERLQGVSIYLGNVWDSYSGNNEVANHVDVPRHSPLVVNVNAQGRYLFVARPGQDDYLTLCEIQVWAVQAPSCIC